MAPAESSMGRSIREPDIWTIRVNISKRVILKLSPRERYAQLLKYKGTLANLALDVAKLEGARRFAKCLKLRTRPKFGRIIARIEI